MSKVQRHIVPLHFEGNGPVLQQTCRLQASVMAKTRLPLRDIQHPIQQENLRASERNPRRLVIFDKDGTLVCIHAMWTPWIRGLVDRLQNATGLNIADKIFKLLSFDNNTGKILPGLLGEGTMPEIHATLTRFLTEEGVPRQKAEDIMQECWQARDFRTYGGIHTVGDVGALFRVLKSNGYLIAVNTSDSRVVTEFTLDHLNLRQHVDMIVCGDDEGVLPKPHPWTAQKICSELKVEPSDVIMIGDSPCDMKLGLNAGFRCSIGVLTGIAPREVLEQDTTHVVDDIHQALDLII